MVHSLLLLGALALATARSFPNQHLPSQHTLDLHERDIFPDEAYDWLEPQPPLGPEALAWSANQTQTTISTFNSFPRTAAVLSQVANLASAGQKIPTVEISGGRLWRTGYSDSLPRGFVEVSESGIEWEVAVDVESVSEAEGKELRLPFEGASLYSGAALGARYIIQLSENVTDEVGLREINLSTGEVVENGFNTGLGLVYFAWLDADTLLISHTITEGIPVTPALYPAVWQIWKRGTPLTSAREVLRVDESSVVAYTYPLGESGTGRALMMEFTAVGGFRFHIYNPGGKITEVEGLPRLVVRFEPSSTARHLIVVTAEAATIAGREVPEGSILAYDFLACGKKTDRLSVVWSPGEGEFTPHIMTHGLGTSRSRVWFTVSTGGEERRLAMEFRSGKWEIVDEVQTVSGGIVQMISGDVKTDAVVVVETGLITPSVMTLLRPEEEEDTILFQQKEYFNSSAFTTSIETATSADGTLVDYLLVTPKSFESYNSTPGHRPVLMHGYGGFGYSLDLTYLDIAYVPWLEAGGSVVYAFIRGGGERGSAWHYAAVGPENRQRAFDDFIAIAEKLITSGLTSSENLGAHGHSNGGLLMGVMLTQRPDLFGALVSDAPVMDMLKYVSMSGAGVSWVPEFGDPSDPEVAELLRGWSPFHNVEEGVEYPPFLTTVANTDFNNGPGHPRKIVAKLKDAGVEEAFLYVVEEGGHALLDSYRNPVLMGHRTAFLMHYLMD